MPIDHLAARLVDVHHFMDFEGLTLAVRRSGIGEGDPVEEQVLFGCISCIPYAEDPDPRIPTVSVNLTTDCWIDHLDTVGVTYLAEKPRAQADRLVSEGLPARLAARADWETHTGPGRMDSATEPGSPLI